MTFATPAMPSNPTYYLTERQATTAANRWARTPEGIKLIEGHTEPGAVLYTYRHEGGWDWAIRTGPYTLTSFDLTNNYAADIFCDAPQLAAWLSGKGIIGDTGDLLRRAALGALPLVVEDAASQPLLFRLLLTVSPNTPDDVLAMLMDDPEELVRYHAMNRVLRLGASPETVTQAQVMSALLEDDLLNELLGSEA